MNPRGNIHISLIYHQGATREAHCRDPERVRGGERGRKEPGRGGERGDLLRVAGAQEQMNCEMCQDIW